MHNIGPTQIEVDGHPHAIGGGSGRGGQAGETGEFGELGETGETESPFSEMQELALASELLEVSSEAELEQFLGGLFNKVAGAASQFARSDTGRALGGILK